MELRKPGRIPLVHEREVAGRNSLRVYVGAEELSREGAPGRERNQVRLPIKGLTASLIAIES
jgi:hypothetical protein